MTQASRMLPPRKLLDSSRNLELGWQASTSFYEGIRLAYSDFLGRDVKIDRCAVGGALPY